MSHSHSNPKRIARHRCLRFIVVLFFVACYGGQIMAQSTALPGRPPGAGVAPPRSGSNAPSGNRPAPAMLPVTRPPAPPPAGGNPQAKVPPAARPAVPVPSALPSQRLAAGQGAQGAATQTSCLLQSSRKTGCVDMIEMILEANGTVYSSENDENKGENIEIVAGFRFEEKTQQYSFVPGEKLSSIRLYDQAGMKRLFRGETVRPLLDISRKYITCQYNGKKLLHFSPNGPLKNEQYLLLEELPCNPLLLDLLLPNKTVSLGNEWTVSDDLLCSLLGLEAIERNTLKMVLSAIIDDVAEVDIFLDGGTNSKGEQLPGSIEGASMGASVSLEVQGKFQFDLKAKRLTWLGMRLEEFRGGSHVEPRMETTAVLRIKLAPLAEDGKLTDDAVASLDQTATAEKLQLVYQEQNGPWRFAHSRRWRMIEDTDRAAALCLTDKGETIAQCNILLGSKVEAETMPSLEVYKRELRGGLGERFGKIVDETEQLDDKKTLIYSVMIDGQVDEQPFRWLYYLLTDPEGNQVTIVFEIRADFLEKFGEIDDEILRSFEMIPRPQG